MVIAKYSAPQLRPAIMVINIDDNIYSSWFAGIYEKRGQNRSIGTSALNVVRVLEYFSRDDSIKAFILEINATEGQGTGQEEIARQVKRMNKPVVAVIDGKALSAGYYVAASANKIYATKSSQIGNIANTFVYVGRVRNFTAQVCNISAASAMKQNTCPGFSNLEFNNLHQDVVITHTILSMDIAGMRHMPASVVQQLSNVTLSSEQAKELGLVDEIGGMKDAIQWIENELSERLWIIYLRDMVSQEHNEKS